MADTIGIESFRSMLKRSSYHGTCHHMREKHLNRYANESAGWHDVRCCNTVEQMGWVKPESISLIVTSLPCADQQKDLYGGVHPDDYGNRFLPKPSRFRQP